MRLKEKILYFSNLPTDFQVARYLQDHGFELYGIFDVPDLLKKTFEEQEIITFKKTWYYRDYLKQDLEQIDENYLIEFEQRHKINLWSLLYADRNLYYYNDYHIFNNNEILKIAEQTAKFYESIIDEINPSYIRTYTPDHFHTELLYEICKSKGIKILTLSHARPFPNRYIISETTDQLDNKNSIFDMQFNDELKSFNELQNLIKDNYNTISPQKLDLMLSHKTKLKGFFHYINFVLNNKYRKYHANFGRTKTKFLFIECSKIIKTLCRKYYIDQKLKRQINLKESFVYFPLHFQPERSTLSVAQFFTNQIEVIRHIIKSLPVNYKLYVKEHPMQEVAAWRPISYYKEISNMPNVELLHPLFSNDELLENTSLVFAITGTVACTAAFYEKPSIVFGNVSFDTLPSVYRVSNLETLPSLVKKALKTKVDIYDLNKFVKFMFDNSFEFNFYDLFVPMMKEFFYDGLSTDVYVKKLDVEAYLTKKKPLLKKWSDELIKKINQHKTMQMY